MFTEKDLVKIAKRENNNKRKYLVVNQLQGKHIPVSGKVAFSMFDELAQDVKNSYFDEKLLLVGFAETATAIGARLAVVLNSYYMQTTREQIDGVEYLFFTESHSHATEQKLIKNDIDSVIDEIVRIVFVEDEVTTGNTIMKIIDIIEKLYPNKVKFSVASLLNGMDEEALSHYKKRDIEVHFLVKTDHSKYTEIADSFKGDGDYIAKNTSAPKASVDEIAVNNYQNARRLVKGNDYNSACEKLFADIIHNEKDNLANSSSVLVIGTEEFMYPALYVASRLEENGFNVRCHSTTRSPIATSSEENYPLQKRYELASFFEDERKTFIYDLKKYDCVLIITDSTNQSKIGANSLINALNNCGNDNIVIYRWCNR